MLEYGCKYLRFWYKISDRVTTESYSYQVLYKNTKDNHEKIHYLSDFVFYETEYDDGLYSVDEFIRRCKLFEELCKKEGIEIVRYTPNYIICEPNNNIIQGECIEDIYKVVA